MIVSHVALSPQSTHDSQGFGFHTARLVGVLCRKMRISCGIVLRHPPHAVSMALAIEQRRFAALKFNALH
eukprot:5907744-Amphidinium_carterae.1